MPSYAQAGTPLLPAEDGRPPPVYAILLAAGASTRFGSPKQCAQLDGQTLIRRALSAATEAVGPAVRVVLGAGAAEIAATLELQAEQLVFNLHWTEGIAASIRLGISQLPEGCAGALCLLADQPYVTGASLGRLISQWRGAPDQIVASSYGSVIGAPCVFPRWCFSDLMALQGDQGARVVIARHWSSVLATPHPEASIDIDTPQQLAELQASTPVDRQSGQPRRP